MLKQLTRYPRVLALLGATGSFALIAAALYMEHIMDLEPCPLCIFQRVALMGAGCCLLMGALLGRWVWLRRLWSGLAALASGTGLALAARHVWLQHLPEDEVPTCGPGLDYLMEIMPLQEVLSFVLQGSGECAEVSWRWLGLSIPEWTVLAFTGYLLLSLIVALAPADVRSRA